MNALKVAERSWRGIFILVVLLGIVTSTGCKVVDNSIEGSIGNKEILISSISFNNNQFTFYGQELSKIRSLALRTVSQIFELEIIQSGAKSIVARAASPMTLPITSLVSLSYSTVSASTTVPITIDLSGHTVTNFTSTSIKDNGTATAITVDASNSVALGTSTVSTGLTLDVGGAVGATQYCDQDGANCFSATDVGSGGGSGNWTLTGSDLSYSGGGVAIGTTNPTYEFEVYGGSNTQFKVDVGSGVTKAIAYGSNAGHIWATDSATGSNRTYIFDGGGGSRGQVGTTRSRLEVWAGTSGTQENMSILSTRRVGISDSSPDARIEISGDLSSDDYLMISSDDANDGDIVVVKNNGDVGIGTPSPQATLDINGFVRLSRNGVQPVACSPGTDGSIALTAASRICVCNGTLATWVYSSDGTTACVW